MPLGCAWLRLNTATIGTLDLMHTLDSISTPQAFFNSPGLYFKFQLPRPFSTPQAFLLTLFPLPRPFQMFDHPCLQLNILFKSIYIYMME